MARGAKPRPSVRSPIGAPRWWGSFALRALEGRVAPPGLPGPEVPEADEGDPGDPEDDVEAPHQSPSRREALPKRRLDDRGVGLAARLFHHRPAEEAERLGLAGPDVRNPARGRGDDLVHDLAERPGIRDLAEALLFDDGRRRGASFDVQRQPLTRVRE